jgi:PAS domain S-box-containing protein
VDDSPSQAKRVAGVLSASYTVDVFPDARGMLERLSRGGDAPHLLVLDWRLPGDSGLETCRFLRERYDEWTLPILAVTSGGEREDLRQALAAGANDCLHEPYDDAELLARTRTLVRVRQHAEALHEREEAEAALRASRERYRTLFESIDDGYCLLQVHFDAAGRPVDYRFLETNTAFETHTGLRNAVGSTARELVPDLDTFWFELYGRVALTGQSVRFESDAPAMGRSFEVYANRVGSPELRQVALVFKDVTARKAAEAERKELLARERAARTEAEAERTSLTTILATLEEGVILQDAQGVLLFSNKAAERLLGLNADQLAGRTSADLRWGAVRMDGSPYPGEEHPPMRALRSGQGLKGDVMGVHHPDGRLVWLAINAQPLFGPDGMTPVGVVSSFLDVTAERAAEAERERLLREVEVAHTRLATLVEHAPAIICLLRGPDHVFVLVNPPYQRLVGTSRRLVGLPVREALPEVVEQGLIGLLDDVYRTGQPFFGSEVPIRLDRRGDGTLEDAFLNQVYQPVRDVAGRVVGIDAFSFDVTEQVRARQRVEALAERLRESEERLRRVVEASGTGTWELDVATELTVADAHFREMSGLSADGPFSLDKGLSLVHPEDRPRVAEAFAEALAGRNGGRLHAEYRTVPTSDGRWRWVESRGQARFDADGRCERILGTVVDVTARKEAEAAREAFLDALAMQPGVAVAMFRGPDLIVDMANPLYRQLAGGRDVVGQPLLRALPELRGQGIDELAHRVLRTGEPFIGREYPIRFDRRAEGVLEKGYFHVVFQPVRGPDGAPRSVLTIAQEVTDVVHARQEAERLMALEQERAGFEQQLIGIVSHDLRSPIAAITMGAAVLLRRPDMEERQRRTVERILSSAGRANRMIHDLLDFTQARLGGGLTAQRLPGDFHAIVRQVVEESQVSNPGRFLRLTQTGDGGGEWDADRLSQLVSNLLSNALHYSPPGSTVRIETRGEPEHLVLAVHNAGAPIPPEVLPRLFQPLQRGVSGVSEVRSVGLGLYIVDQVVRAHGGSISVTSSREDGTTFTVCLPRRRLSEAAPHS